MNMREGTRVIQSPGLPDGFDPPSTAVTAADPELSLSVCTLQAMTPQQVQYIRDRLADWEAVPAMARAAIDRPKDDGRWVMWSTDDVAVAGRHLRVLVDAAESVLGRPEGDPDRAWAVAFLASLLLIWSDRPDYPKVAPA